MDVANAYMTRNTDDEGDGIVARLVRVMQILDVRGEEDILEYLKTLAVWWSAREMGERQKRGERGAYLSLAEDVYVLLREYAYVEEQRIAAKVHEFSGGGSGATQQFSAYATDRLYEGLAALREIIRALAKKVRPLENVPALQRVN